MAFGADVGTHTLFRATNPFLDFPDWMPPITRAQDFGFDYSTPSGRWQWVTRMDMRGAAPDYSVRDIVSPWGILRDSIPIPGDVVSAMAQSIQQLQDNFKPNILLAPTSFTVTVDEGRGVSGATPLVITNNGVYGSLLDVSLTTSAIYLVLDHVTLGNLSSNESGTVQVSADSTNLVASSSPYHETITVQDATALNTPQTASVTIVVRPKAVIATSVDLITFTVARPISGPFPAIPTQSFLVENTGPSGSILNYQIERLYNTSCWLASFLPVTDILSSGGTRSTVVTVVPPVGFSTGTYEEVLRISGYSSNVYSDVRVQLIVT